MNAGRQGSLTGWNHINQINMSLTRALFVRFRIISSAFRTTSSIDAFVLGQAPVNRELANDH